MWVCGSPSRVVVFSADLDLNTTTLLWDPHTCGCVESPDVYDTDVESTPMWILSTLSVLDWFSATGEGTDD